MFLKIEHINYTQLFCRQSMQVVPSKSTFFYEYYVAWAYPYSEAEVQRCSVKKVFLKISKNSLGNTSARVSLSVKLHAYKVAGLRPVTLLKMRLWHRCFPVNFMKFLRTPFFTEHSEAFPQWCPYKKLLCKYTAILQEKLRRTIRKKFFASNWLY